MSSAASIVADRAGRFPRRAKTTSLGFASPDRGMGIPAGSSSPGNAPPDATLTPPAAKTGAFIPAHQNGQTKGSISLALMTCLKRTCGRVSAMHTHKYAHGCISGEGHTTTSKSPAGAVDTVLSRTRSDVGQHSTCSHLRRITPMLIRRTNAVAGASPTFWTFTLMALFCPVRTRSGLWTELLLCRYRYRVHVLFYHLTSRLISLRPNLRFLKRQYSLKFEQHLEPEGLPVTATYVKLLIGFAWGSVTFMALRRLVIAYKLLRIDIKVPYDRGPPYPTS